MVNNQNKWKVYKHTAPSGKVYIGITSRTLKERWQNGRGYKKNTIMKLAIEKYGWNNISHELISENLSEEEAKNLEIKLIAEYKKINMSYNLDEGGSASTHCKRTRDILRKNALKQDLSKFLEAGAKCKLERQRPVVKYDKDGNFLGEWSSIKLAADENNVLASHIGECCRSNNILKSYKGFIWRYKEDEFEYRKNPQLRPVVQYDLEWNILNTYESMYSAAKAVNGNHGSISMCCTKKRKSHKGFRWSYK